MPNLVVYDTETTTNMSGPEKDFNQVIQIASILYDQDLNKKDSFNFSCSPLPWSLFSPGALLTNKKIDAFDNEITHYQLIKSTWEKWKSWTDFSDSIFISYNGDMFDEEVMRRQFFWNLIDPYFTSREPRSRLDVLPKLFPLAIFYKNDFDLPYIDKKVSFKLENIAKSYGIDTTDAHDAYADCIFLYELIKQIKKNVPNYFEEIILTTNKIKKIEHLTSNEIHFDCTRYGNNNPVYVFSSANISNQLLVSFNLNFDPIDYFDLSYSELEHLINSKKTLPFKKINVSRSNSLISLETLNKDNVKIENLDLYRKNRDIIKENKNFLDKVLDIFNNKTYESKPTDIPEQSLYSGGFLTKKDIDIFNKFHDESNLDEKIKIINSLDDDRYIQFAKRICAQEFPDTAPQDYLIHCRNLVVTRFNEKGPWPDADKYLDDANKLLEDISSDEDKKFVNASIDQINKNRIN